MDLLKEQWVLANILQHEAFMRNTEEGERDFRYLACQITAIEELMEKHGV